MLYQLSYSRRRIRARTWWRGEDSNLRRLRRQIYSLLPLTAREPLLYSYDLGSSSSRSIPAWPHLELAKGIEPPTSSLQVRCSTVELRQQPSHNHHQTYQQNQCVALKWSPQKLQTPLRPVAREFFLRRSLMGVLKFLNTRRKYTLASLLSSSFLKSIRS